MMLVDIAFYLFASVLVLSALMVISARNPVHSVLWLILAFFNAAGLFVMLGAEFVAMILVIVYVGAVAVLFLFVVMMLNVDAEELRRGFMQYVPLGALVGVILFLQLVFILTANFMAPDQMDITAQLPIDAAVTNTKALGLVLYTKYAYVFQVCGLILLVAMIGAIVLTLRQRPGVLKQSINTQINRSRADTIEMQTPKPGEGVQL
ncbi:MAG: NADH-quinone oxidoreductase subunit J [Bdellovibrionales bacterium]